VSVDPGRTAKRVTALAAGVEPLSHLVARIRQEQDLADTADDTPPHTCRTLLDRRVQAVLRHHPVAHVRRAQAHAADAPRAGHLAKRIVGVHRLVRAMECTNAHVDDTDAQRIDRIRRPRDRSRHAVERGSGQLRRWCTGGHRVTCQAAALP